jgi:hypothetical protein
LADVGEEEAHVDGDVGGVLVGGVGGALVGVPFPTHMSITALLLVVPLLLLLICNTQKCIQGNIVDLPILCAIYSS